MIHLPDRPVLAHGHSRIDCYGRHIPGDGVCDALSRLQDSPARHCTNLPVMSSFSQSVLGMLQHGRVVWFVWVSVSWPQTTTGQCTVVEDTACPSDCYFGRIVCSHAPTTCFSMVARHNTIIQQELGLVKHARAVALFWENLEACT